MRQVSDMSEIAPLFDGWNETMIWSCLQGYHGRAWADDEKPPRSAQIVVGDFCVFAGVPCAELAAHIPPDSVAPLLIPQNEAWAAAIEKAHGERCERFSRYAIKKEPNVFDKAKLQAFADAVPLPYTLHFIDEALYHKALQEPWSRDLCSQFASYADYAAHGLGVAALLDGEPVAGASSYTAYEKGIEIEVDTKEEHRRKGLALGCAAKLILACLKRGLYPSWDAHDLRSVALAQKLGYHLDYEYAAYEMKELDE